MNSLKIRLSRWNRYLFPSGVVLIIMEYGRPQKPIFEESGKIILGQSGDGI